MIRKRLRPPTRLLAVGAFTVVEVAALAIWLATVRGQPLDSPLAIAGVGVLSIGLFVEGVATYRTVNGLDARIPAGTVAVLAATGTACWVGWLWLAERLGGAAGIAVAGLVLAVLLVPQHTVEDNVLRGERAFSWIVDGRTAGFSAVEAAGATAWLLVVTGELPASTVLGGVVGIDTLTAAASLASALVPGTVGPGWLVGACALTVALFLGHVGGVRFANRTTGDATPGGVGSAARTSPGHD